jgi:hypothetical protein
MSIETWRIWMRRDGSRSGFKHVLKVGRSSCMKSPICSHQYNCSIIIGIKFIARIWSTLITYILDQINVHNILKVTHYSFTEQNNINNHRILSRTLLLMDYDQGPQTRHVSLQLNARINISIPNLQLSASMSEKWIAHRSQLSNYRVLLWSSGVDTPHHFYIAL